MKKFKKGLEFIKKKKKAGFTLVELLVVIGILAVIIAIVLIAINPLETFNKTADVATQAVTRDLASSAKVFYAQQKSAIWHNDNNCKNELSTQSTVDKMPNCIQQLTQDPQLQQKVTTSSEGKEINMTQCNDSLAICFKVKSNAFKNNAQAKYDKNGAVKQGCPGGDDCYICNFTTNEGQECFQAMQPNASLSQATTNPDTVLPMIPRASESICSNASQGQASCMADVVTDDSGTPLSTLAVPNGFGPQHLHRAYNLPCTPGGPVYSKCETPSTFGPKIVAIVDAFHTPTIEQDLAVYSETYGLPPCTVANGCLTIVNQNGTTSPMPPVRSDWALEASLDVQMAHGICQTCKILLVEADSNTYLNLGIAVKKAGQMGATVISNSYGGSEWNGISYYDQYYDLPGVGVTASTGDWGYGAYYPAASNKVIAVGGTTLSLYSDFSYAGESVWSGTGSGCSGYESAKSFQTSLSNWAQTGCGTKKGIGDVSAVANPSTGVAVYDTTSYAGRTGWWVLGGTSVSSPLYAAVLALQGGVPAGVDGVTIPYQNKDKLRDVTQGSNGSCGNASCTAGVGYDGPTGLGSPNLLPSAVNTTQTPTPSVASSPTITFTPTPTLALQTPTPTLISSPSATPTPPSCTNAPTAYLDRTSTSLANPGDTVQYTLTIKSNDSPGCNAYYSMSYGYPYKWGFTIQNPVQISGGQTKQIPLSISVPATTTSGNYQFQVTVGKPPNINVGPLYGYIQVLGPSNTPTPTPVSCNNMWTNKLGFTSLSGAAGSTVNQTLTITNNNPSSCGSAVYGISHSEPAGWTILDLPPSVTLTGGQSTTINFGIVISTGAYANSTYLITDWVNGGNGLSTTINVTATSQPPPGQLFSNFTPKFYGDYMLSEFSYNQNGSSNFRMDVATDPSALNQTTGPNSAAYYGFSYTTGNAMDSSNNATQTSVRGFINRSPQSWSGWQCGHTIYYRMYNAGDLRIASPIESGIVDCTTVINVLPWDPWYAAIYQGVYDARYDPDYNGVVNWDDYWILVRATRLR